MKMYHIFLSTCHIRYFLGYKCIIYGYIITKLEYIPTIIQKLDTSIASIHKKRRNKIGYLSFYMLILMMGNNTFTLYLPRLFTEQVKTASLPTGKVTFAIGSSNSGSGSPSGVFESERKQKLCIVKCCDGST